MFWVRLGYIVSTIILILLIIAWILIINEIHEMYLEEKIKEDRKYDINHKTIKDLKVRK